MESQGKIIMKHFIDSFEYMENSAFVGFKLCNLQYTNNPDCDNNRKYDPIYPLQWVRLEDINLHSLTRRFKNGNMSRDKYIYYRECILAQKKLQKDHK